MTLLTMIMCIGLHPSFWHDASALVQREAQFRRALVVAGQQAQDEEVIQRAITLHQPF
jgi:hypothetical protein